MTDYEEKFEAALANIEQKAKSTENEYHSDMLWNYLHHVALEYSEVLEPAFEEGLFVDDPKYVFYFGQGGKFAYEGLEAVKDQFYVDTFYELPFSSIVFDETLFVEDWGIGSYHSTATFPTGEQVLEMPSQFGVEEGGEWEPDDIDPDAQYISETRSSMFWPYDEEARLIGEEVFNRGPDNFREATDDDVIVTKERRKEIAKQYWPESVKEKLEA